MMLLHGRATTSSMHSCPTPPHHHLPLVARPLVVGRPLMAGRTLATRCALATGCVLATGRGSDCVGCNILASNGESPEGLPLTNNLTDAADETTGDESERQVAQFRGTEASTRRRHAHDGRSREIRLGEEGNRSIGKVAEFGRQSGFILANGKCNSSR